MSGAQGLTTLHTRASHTRLIRVPRGQSRPTGDTTHQLSQHSMSLGLTQTKLPPQGLWSIQSLQRPDAGVSEKYQLLEQLHSSTTAPKMHGPTVPVSAALPDLTIENSGASAPVKSKRLEHHSLRCLGLDSLHGRLLRLWSTLSAQDQMTFSLNYGRHTRLQYLRCCDEYFAR